MNLTDPGASPPPTLRLNIRRTLLSGVVRQKALAAGTLASIATIKFENAVFQTIDQFEFNGGGGVSISFPQPAVLRIALRPVAQCLAQGMPALVFAHSISLLKNIGVRLLEPAVAVVGEMTHTRFIGELALSVVDSTDTCTLPAEVASRPFALTLPSAPTLLAHPVAPIASAPSHSTLSEPARRTAPAHRTRLSHRPEFRRNLP